MKKIWIEIRVEKKRSEFSFTNPIERKEYQCGILHTHTKEKWKKKEKIDGIKIKRNFQFSIKKKHNVTKTKHWFLFRNISKSHSFARFFRFHRYSFQSIETRYLLYNGEIRSSIKREHSPVKNRVTVWLKIFCESIVLCFTIKEIRAFLKI